MLLKVKGQRLFIDDVETISEGAINFVTFSLICDKSWDGLVRTVRFSHEESDRVYDIPDIEENKIYYVPAEVLKKGRVWVGVIGTSDNTVASTEKVALEITSAIDGGKTPSITPDAYAKYVSEVTSHRRASEEAEREALTALAECKRLTADADIFARGAVISRYKAEKIYEEVSGMLDAVGAVLMEMKRIEERLSSADSKFSLAEAKREGGERSRIVSEKGRNSSEEERRESELLREAAEIRRNTAEQTRALGEVNRDKRIRELEKTLLHFEESLTTPVTAILSRASGEGEIHLQGPTQIDELSLFGKSEILDGKILGSGESGEVSLTLDGKEHEISITSPLYSTPDISDELKISKNGDISVVRRVAKTVVSYSSPIFCDGIKGERVLYATPLGSVAYSGEGEAVTTDFSYGMKPEENSVWISGEYIFFSLDAKKYPNVTAFAERLKKSPITLLYPRLAPVEEHEGSVSPLPLVTSIKSRYKMELHYKKDIFEALEKINTRLDKFEKEKEK